jgi:hypothetical protein
MTSSKMTRGFGAFTTLTLAGAAVLVFHSAALAQQAEPDAKDSQKAKAEPVAEPEAKQPPPQGQDLPPEYGPPPGYRQPPQPHGYPPPGYGPYYNDYYGPPGYAPPPQRYYRPRYYQQPVRYYPEPLAYRPFFFGVGLGVGGVALFPPSGSGEKSSSRAGMSYNLHFGFGVSPRWSIVLSGDGAFSYFSGYSIDQSVWSIGPQVFITHHLYARGGLGVATKSVDYSSSSMDYYADTGYSDSGMGWTGALGWEFMQSYHTTLGLELAGTFGHYQNVDAVTGSKNQGTIGLNFMLQLF